MRLARDETHTLQLTLSSTTGWSSRGFSRPLGDSVLSRVAFSHDSPQPRPDWAQETHLALLGKPALSSTPNLSLPLAPTTQNRVTAGFWRGQPQSKHSSTCRAFQRNQVQHGESTQCSEVTETGRSPTKRECIACTCMCTAETNTPLQSNRTISVISRNRNCLENSKIRKWVKKSVCYVWNLEKWYWWTYLRTGKRLRHREWTCGHSGRRRGWMIRERSVEAYTLPFGK